ncbi:hypothetical protein GCM10010109_65780 [Actinoplanes campanulatus]|nr:hypothetical protein GCM10010109_65780 [Actinoplanes campanulatus]GID40331.1 hypothetical protein Aca09nite_68370 [Actinoplanes campanulatus]
MSRVLYAPSATSHACADVNSPARAGLCRGAGADPAGSGAGLDPPGAGDEVIGAVGGGAEVGEDPQDAVGSRAVRTRLRTSTRRMRASRTMIMDVRTLVSVRNRKAQ